MCVSGRVLVCVRVLVKVGVCRCEWESAGECWMQSIQFSVVHPLLSYQGLPHCSHLPHCSEHRFQCTSYGGLPTSHDGYQIQPHNPCPVGSREDTSVSVKGVRCGVVRCGE